MGSERRNKSGFRSFQRRCSFKSGKNNPIDFSRVFSETRLPFCTARLSYPQKRIAVARSEDAPGELVGSPATLLLGRDQATYPIAGEVLKDANTGQVFFTATLSGDAKGLAAVRRGLAPLLESGGSLKYAIIAGNVSTGSFENSPLILLQQLRPLMKRFNSVCFGAKK